MISVQEAQTAVLQQAAPLAPQAVPLSDALGLILAESAVSDVDSPPHDKSLVDGYALVAADLAEAGRELTVLEEVTAGMVPSRPVESGAATRIMTGAPIPQGADAVVMVERTESRRGADGSERVVIQESKIAAGQNILPRATSLRKGERVIDAGCVLRPIEIGVLAEIGYARVSAVPRPRVAVLATGNELVEAGESPGAGRIRNSNGPLLLASARAAGGLPEDLGIARDDPRQLAEKIARGLESDVLLLSGGVSAGVLDLVPRALAQQGVEQVFHKVNVKPGKPVWFGLRRDASGPKLVFGLPGNPVSSLVCFELFVRPALAKLAGHPSDATPLLSAILRKPARQRGDRPTYFPSRLTTVGGNYEVETLAWKGSADQRTLVQANALTVLPAGDLDLPAGESVKVIPLAGSF